MDRPDVPFRRRAACCAALVLSSAAAAAMAAAAPVAPAAAAAAAKPVKAAPAQAAAAPGAVAGVAAAEWTVRWWRWANNAFPDGLAPYRDRDGRLCATGQDERGPVWFLAGTDGSFAARRRCRVPAGAHLLVPVINMYFHAPTAGPNAMDCAEVKRAAAVNNDYLASAVVLLDGKPLARPLRLASRCFDPQAARAHPGPDRGSRYRAAADGYWLLLPPLAPGPHRLSVGANYGNPYDSEYGRMQQNFEYQLQVGDLAI